MVTFFVDKVDYPINSYWSHYKSNPETTHRFALVISLDEIPLVNIIENYAECSIGSIDFRDAVLEKDKTRRSMGLMWNLSLAFKEKYTKANNESFIWVVNNIRHVNLTNDELHIEGDATIFDSAMFNG